MNLLHSFMRSQRFQAIVTLFAMSALLLNPYLQISFSAQNGVAQATSYAAPSCTPFVESFDDLSAGDIVTSGDGYTLSVDSNGDYDQVMVFNTLNPTGGDDDLTTKDGDRYGVDNNSELGNALIISENGKTNNPDDEKEGGVMTFSFDAPRYLDYVVFLDIEETGGSVTVYDDTDTSLGVFSIANKGDNSYQKIAIATENVSKMVVNLIGSGAIPQISWCVPETETELISHPVTSCTGIGTLFTYADDQYQPIFTSFTATKDEVLIFTRSEVTISVTVNGSPAALTTKADQSFAKVYALSVTPGDVVSVTGNMSARYVQGYLVQDAAHPVFDLSTFEIVIDDAKDNDMYLTAGDYSYLFFDKYTLISGSDDSRNLSVAITGPSGTLLDDSYTKPYPSPAEGIVLKDYTVTEEGTYTMSVDTEDSVYWAYQQCPAPERGSIAGCKYEDANNNGVIDSSEQTLSGWNIILSQNGTEVASTTTGDNGCYTFDDLELGDYVVTEQMQSGWTQTYPASGQHDITLTSAQTVGAVDFANYEEPATYCGDGLVQMPNDYGQNEQCDDGVNNGIACTPTYGGDSCSYCSNTCEPVVVDPPYCGDGVLQDTEGEQCDDGNNVDGDGCSAQCMTEIATCELDITKVVDKSTAKLGDALTYTIKVENIGDGDCTDVVVTDTFPGGIAVTSSTPNPSSGQNVWNIGLMEPGDIETISIEAEVQEDNNLCESTITNSAVYTSTETGESDPVTADTTIECDPPSGECRLELVKTDKTDPIAPGQNLEYTLTLTNVGDASCTRVTLEEEFDANTTFVSSSIPFSRGTIWDVGSLLPAPADNQFVVDVTVLVADNAQLCESQLINTAYHDSSQTTRASVVETTDVVCTQEPVYDVALTKTVNDDSVRVDEQVAFTVTVTNEGSETMTGVVVADYLPSELRLDTSAVTAGSFDESTLEWTVGDLTAGQTESLSLTVTVTAAGTFVNKAEVIAHNETDVDSTPNNGTDNGEDDTDNASVSADNGGGGCVTNCGGGGPVYPHIVITKTAAVQFTNPDTIVAYTLSITNNGNATGNDLVVTDNLPSPLTYVSSTITGVWNLGDITVGETKTITYDVQYPENISDGNYTNIAKAEISNGNSDEDDAVVEVRTTTVFGEQYEPLLSIEKSVDRSFTNPGGEAVYTVTVTNVTTHNVTAKNVILTDRMPNIFTFQINGASVNGWELGDLAPGESKTVVYTIDVSADATNGSYDNIAAAQADNAPSVYATVPLEVREIIIEGFTLPDTNGASTLFLSITAGGLMILLAWMIRKYRELTLIELA